MAAQRAPGPGVGAAAGEQRTANTAKAPAVTPAAIRSPADVTADRDRADGEQQHRDAEQQPDGAPDELENAEQMKMRAHVDGPACSADADPDFDEGLRRALAARR